MGLVFNLRQYFSACHTMFMDIVAFYLSSITRIDVCKWLNHGPTIDVYAWMTELRIILIDWRSNSPNFHSIETCRINMKQQLTVKPRIHNKSYFSEPVGEYGYPNDLLRISSYSTIIPYIVFQRVKIESLWTPADNSFCFFSINW